MLKFDLPFEITIFLLIGEKLGYKTNCNQSHLSTIVACTLVLGTPCEYTPSERRWKRIFPPIVEAAAIDAMRPGIDFNLAAV